MSRNAQGEGSVYRRADGRWVGSVFVETTAGTRRRLYIYGRTRREAHAAMTDRLVAVRRGVRSPMRTWRLGEYVAYWLEEVAGVRDRPNTIDNYQGLWRNHLVSLANLPLEKLTVSVLQSHLNQLTRDGVGARTVQATRSLIRAVLSQAEREELVPRNVAKLVQIPPATPAPVTPWSQDEAAAFLAAAVGHRWYAAFVLSLRLGLRRGEVLGLTWGDLDKEASILSVRQQLQRLRGELVLSPLKTEASRRRLALVGLPREAVRVLEPDQRSELGLIFTSAYGTPVDPKNFARAFHAIREKAGLRRIKLHHARHTAATLLKDAGVSARDTQLILGHANVRTTQEIYQHGDGHGQRAALTVLEQALVTAPVAVKVAVKPELSTGQGTDFGALTSGGTTGARTQDTLLKRSLEALDFDTRTPVLQQLRTHTRTQLFGHVAVKLCCQSDEWVEPSAQDQLRAIARAVDEHRYVLLSKRSFPYCLIESRRP